MVENDLGKVTTNHAIECISSFTYQDFLTACIEPAATLSLNLYAVPLTKKKDTKRSIDDCSESFAVMTKSEMKLRGTGTVTKKNVLTRDLMVHKLRELKYDSLAVALETGTLKKLDPTPVIAELRNLHASLF